MNNEKYQEFLRKFDNYEDYKADYEEYQQFIKQHKDRLFHFKRLNAPEILIEDSEEKSNYTFEQWLSDKISSERIAEEEYQQLKSEFVISEEQAKLIFQKFDLWFDRYKDNEVILDNYYLRFFEPWLWGNINLFADPEFYEKIFDEKYLEVAWKHPVFAACQAQVNNRLKELEQDEEKNERIF